MPAPLRYGAWGEIMPIYEYVCGACGEESEFLQKMSEGPKRKCPECGALKLKRKISAVGFRLKGGGWYETDFKSSDSQRNLHKSDDKPASKKSEKSSDKKNSGSSKSTAKTKKASAD